MPDRSPPPPSLPEGLTVLERGWLSSNNIVIQGRQSCALVDSGYCSHAEHTLTLVQAALNGRSLDVLANTHLHSDHCGGNAAFQATYPTLTTLIPPGHSEHVRDWDPYALSYTPTGQSCPRFGFDALLVPGTEILLGDLPWQIHAAPGHDPHSVILFEPTSRVLISADALWEKGFGVVFPELEGVQAFDAVGATIDLIESLAPAIVIPGHGQVFTGIATSIASARNRLQSFVSSPEKHIRHAAKVLLKFKLLEVQQMESENLLNWSRETPYFSLIFRRQFPHGDFHQWINQLIEELIWTGAAVRERSVIRNR